MEVKLKQGEAKGVYQKPQLRKIELVADEVLGLNCKSPIEPDSFGPLSFECLPAGQCQQPGS
jgi:hypothetical protein